MHAYLGIVDHPYFAVTGVDGRFTLANVPPGSYQVGVWHERFGTREAKVTLGPRGSEDMRVTFAAS